MEPAPLKKSTAIALAVIGLPLLVAALEASRYYIVNRGNGTLISSGRQREYLLHVPKSHDASKPTPLVISLHGAGLWGTAQQHTSRWNAVADREGFIVVYPSAAHELGPSVWEHHPDDDIQVDVQFIADLIDTLQKTYHIDAARIYANGLSNGGGMAFALSCTLSDRIAAFGLVGAAHMTPWSWCTDQRPAPMIAFHGTADPVVPFTGGDSWVAPRPFPDIRDWTANWARRNRCDPAPAESMVAADVRRSEYHGCAEDAEVVLFTIIGGGHTWPGGGELPEWVLGPVNRSIDASSEMWTFFQQHPLHR